MENRLGIKVYSYYKYSNRYPHTGKNMISNSYNMKTICCSRYIDYNIFGIFLYKANGEK